jgi:hypothetical protein
MQFFFLTNPHAVGTGRTRFGDLRGGGAKKGVVVLRGVAQFPLNLTWRIVA